MKTRKAINFDLSVEMLEDYYPNEDYHQAWKDIKGFMLDNAFEHRQYSGYISINSMNQRDIAAFMVKINDTFPWLKHCVKQFDVTDVGSQYSYKEWFDDQAESEEYENRLNNVKTLK